MRFHKIRIENINSLAGSHVIDLEGALSGAGLFLIHGPTGAGKSTILDAICLALYGMTPRLGNERETNAVEIDGTKASSPAHVMTRGTAQCVAEVELSMTSPEGRLERYRASWAVQRARKNPTGAFQDAKRRLERLEQDEWRPLVESTKAQDLKAPFNTMLQGLSFEDFQRTTLLAQFAFRQFLEADEKDRGALLARMTDGGRFREIGRRAYLARRAAEETLRKLEAELGGKVVLDEAEEAERRTLLASKEAEAEALEEALEGLGRKREVWSAWLAAKEGLAKAEADQQAVHEERAARASDLAALAADRSLSPARLALDELTRRAASASAALADAAAAVAARDEVAVRRAAVAERRAAAARAREAASQAYEARRPELAAAEQAWASWMQAQEAVAGKVKEVQAREGAWTNAVAAVEATLAREAEARAELDEVEGQLGQIPQRELLLGQIGSLEAMVEAQQAQRNELARKKAALGKKREDRDRLAARLAELAAAQAALEEAWAAARARVEGAEGALAGLLGGASPEQAARACAERGAEAKALIARLDALDAARAEVAKLGSTLGEVEVEAAQAKAEVDQVGARVAAHEAEERRLEGAIDGARREVELLGRVMHLVEQRSVLSSGQACPLCGSVDHPYVEAPATAPDSAQVQAELEQAQRRVATLTEERTQVKSALEAARREQLRVGARASDGAARAGSLADKLVSARSKVAAEEQALGLGEGPTAPRREAESAELARATEDGERVAWLAKALREARREEERTRAARDRGGAERQEVESDLSKIEGLIGAEEAVVQTTDQMVEAAGGELRQRLEALEIRETYLKTGVAEARRRADLVTELARGREAAAVAVTSAALARGQAEAERDGAARERERAQAERALAEERVAAAKAGLFYEGRDPATVRAELEGAERAARAEDEQAASSLAAEDKALAAAEATAAARREAEAQAQAASSSAELAFEEQRRACGAASAEEVRARSLDEARRVELSALEERLAHRQTAAAAKVEAVRAALADAEARLAREGEAGEAGEAATRMEEIEEQRREATAARGDRQQEVGALRAELQRNEAERAAVAALQGKLAAAREDHGQWSQVAELIGKDEGKAFADIVQALNLRAVIERANARLAGFMGRYALTQAESKDGAPRLEFLVVDRHQDDARRGTKSLSGGESFIVSLALALGLADLRSSRLRIDTLLIDEGFGSLDLKTLQDVLAALTALQAASGAQIGLISHVDAMKEVIPAQIEVVPLGDGRSKVEVRK